MANKAKMFHLRNCDKSFRNIGRRSYWSKETSVRREVVDPGSKMVRTSVVAELRKSGERMAPNVFCSRGGCCLNFGIA